MANHPVAVLGGGRFGTVLAAIMAANDFPVRLWLRDRQAIRSINTDRRNPNAFHELVLPDNLYATDSLDKALASATAVVFAVPSHACREVANEVAPFISSTAVVISTVKGLESSDDPGCGFRRISEVLLEILPQNPVGVISGPNMAVELARGENTATTVASTDNRIRDFCLQALSRPYFRIYFNDDLEGVELAGALKNIYAIIGGMAASMKLGYNSISLLITRSLAEMRRFAVACGASDKTFLGLAGVGDLILTCLSPDSRNYRVGLALASGHSLRQAVSAVGTAEGVRTVEIIYREAKKQQIYMPLLFGLHQILFEGRTIAEIVAELMTTSQQIEDVELSTVSKN